MSGTYNIVRRSSYFNPKNHGCSQNRRTKWKKVDQLTQLLSLTYCTTFTDLLSVYLLNTRLLTYSCVCLRAPHWAPVKRLEGGRGVVVD